MSSSAAKNARTRRRNAAGDVQVAIYRAIKIANGRLTKDDLVAKVQQAVPNASKKQILGRIRFQMKRTAIGGPLWICDNGADAPACANCQGSKSHTNHTCYDGKYSLSEFGETGEETEDGGVFVSVGCPVFACGFRIRVNLAASCGGLPALQTNVTQHINSHAGSVEQFLAQGGEIHSCEVTGCGFSSRYPSCLYRHNAGHDVQNLRERGEAGEHGIHVCRQAGCGYASINVSHFQEHERSHNMNPAAAARENVPGFWLCPAPGCGYASCYRSNMNKHNCA